MKRQPLEAFLGKTGNAIPFAIYAIGDVAGLLEVKAGNAADGWEWPHAILHFERDVALLLSDIEQVKQLKALTGPTCQFIEALTPLIFQQAGVPDDVAMGRLFLARGRDQSGKPISYEQEMEEIERRTSEMRDRRNIDMDRRIAEMDQRILELKKRRELLGNGVEIHVIKERRSGVDRRRDSDRRDVSVSDEDSQGSGSPASGIGSRRDPTPPSAVDSRDDGTPAASDQHSDSAGMKW